MLLLSKVNYAIVNKNILKEDASFKHLYNFFHSFPTDLPTMWIKNEASFFLIDWNK